MSRLLTCPQCRARYRVPSDAIGPDGKTVRCKQCGESWRVSGEAATPDALKLEDLQDAVVETTAQPAAPAPVGSRVMEAKSDAFAAKDAAQTAANEEQLLKAPAAVADRPNVAHAMREMAHETKRRRRVGLITIIWLVTAALLVLALVLAVGFRQPLVERFPGAQATFAALGLDVSPTGVELTPVEARQVRLDGRDYLMVSGEAVNQTADPRLAPTVGFRLLDAGGTELARWSVDTGPGELAPRERRAYATEYPDPPLDAATLQLGVD